MIAVASGSWAVATRLGSGGETAGVKKFAVSPRSFRVVLKEKGELKAAESADIKSEVEGRATIIYLVEEGKAVQKGDLLVELASDEIEDRIRQEELKETNAITAFESAKAELDIQRDKNASDIRKAALDIELKQLELDKYLKGEWARDIKDAEIAIEEAEITLKRERDDYTAAKELKERGYITQTEYEQDEFSFQKAQWDLLKANMAKDVLETYTHVAELRKRESDVEESLKEAQRVKKNADAEETKKARNLEGKEKELALTSDQLGKLREQKEKCRITAPTPGFVVYFSEPWRWGGDQIKEGAEVHERQIIMQLPDTSQMTAVLRVHEAKTDRLSLGQTASVEVEGVPGKQFAGKVTKIAAVADTQNQWLNPDLKEYETEVTLEPTDVPLRPGVTAHVEILVETVENAIAAPVQAVYTKTGCRYVFRENGSGVEPVEVGIGAISTEWVEITSGLSAGDEILLAFDEEHVRLIPDAAPDAGPHGTPSPTHAEGQPDTRQDAGQGEAQPDSQSGAKQQQPASSAVAKTAGQTQASATKTP
ncbi:MAG: efflux RND transporter periplasmic adaptor subunit [Planctomycetes bacterium]|nr:efflux RND transporter periplasmic adaptor subunit [Planctomycetota bacterium]